MTEKKELIQQLKETDPDTYKQYRLEYMKSLFDLKKFQLCAQLRVCSQAGGIPVYPRFSQPDNSESWDDAGNGI